MNSDDKRQGLIYTDDRVTISVIHLVYTRKSIFRVEPGPYNMSNKMLNTLSNSGNSKASDPIKQELRVYRMPIRSSDVDGLFVAQLLRSGTILVLTAGHKL